MKNITVTVPSDASYRVPTGTGRINAALKRHDW